MSKKKLKINRIIFVLIIIIAIFLGIKILRSKNKKEINNSAVQYENTLKGELKFNQEKSNNIKITEIKYIYFETSKKTALGIYLKNEKDNIKNKELKLKIMDENNNLIKEQDIKIEKLRKGESIKINTSINAKIDEKCKIEITEK